MRRPGAALRELVRYVRLHFQDLNVLARRYRTLPRVEGDAPLWVSLTTLPSRIGRLGPALRSLLDQEVRADGIRINLPEFSRREKVGYEIPDFLSRLDCLTVCPCAEDWGPLTKLMPALIDLKDQPEARIVVVDDDTIYPKTLLSALGRASAERPNSAICMRGWKVPSENRHANRRYIQASDCDRLSPVEIVQGASGFLVRAGFLPPDSLRDPQAPPEAFYVDDILVSGTLAKRGVPRLVPPSEVAFVRIGSMRSWGTPSLVHGENLDGHNNNTLYHYFSDHWQLRD